MFDKIQEIFSAKVHVYLKARDTNPQKKTSNFPAEAFRLRLLGFIFGSKSCNFIK